MSVHNMRRSRDVTIDVDIGVAIGVAIDVTIGVTIDVHDGPIIGVLPTTNMAFHQS